MTGLTGHSASTSGGSGKAARAARTVGDHPVVEAGARAGYAVNGVLHLLMAWLALQVAFGNRGAEADPSGAMAVVAATPWGRLMLVAVLVAFLLLAIWQFTETVRADGAGRVAKCILKGVVYLTLAWGALSFVLGGGTSNAANAKDATATLMDLPAGPFLVGAAGVAIAAIGGYQIWSGWTERFLQDLVTPPRRLVRIAGRIGYIARGVALVAVGFGVVTAAATQRPSRSRGLDGALHDLAKLPLGQALLVLVALGLVAYGVYSFSRARRART